MLRTRVLPLVLCITAMAVPALADNTMPSLELRGPADTQEQYMTPVSNLMDQSMELEAEPAATDTITPWSEILEDNDGASSHRQTEVLEADTSVSAIQQDQNQTEKPPKYLPLSAIAVFPVIQHPGNKRAFGDLPVLFSREFSLQMESKAPDTQILHPVYSVEELRVRGLGHVYDEMMDYYIRAGRPEPMALAYLLEHMSDSGHPIARVVFVEADVDFNHPMKPTGFKDRLRALTDDALPKTMKYHVRSRVQVFDSEQPDYPKVWGWSWNKSVNADDAYNVTSSVYADSDSQRAFAKASRWMSREIMVIMPKRAYMYRNIDASVKGKLASDNDSSRNAPYNAPMSDDDRQVLKRILRD